MITRCRICGGSTTSVLDLGPQPLANALRQVGESNTASHPLELLVCTKCFHGQLSTVVPAELLYSQYAYASSTIPPLVRYFAEFAEFAKEFVDPSQGVLEIACNDGAQLEALREAGWKRVEGVDPAGNLVERARGRGFTVHRGFWGTAMATSRKGPIARKFGAVVAQNVLAHVNDPHDFLAACDQVLAPGGRVFLQTSHANWLTNGEFDTIYHEHLSYFNCRSWRELLKDHWRVEHLEMVPSNGTSYLLVVGRRDEVRTDGSFALRLAEEKALGYYELGSYTTFKERVHRHLGAIADVVDAARARHEVVFGYGAAAKGITALNLAGVRLPFVVDDSPLKQGRLLPGSETPIVGPDHLRQLESGRWFVLATATLYRDEILRSLKRLGRQGTLCTYLPTITTEEF